MLSLPKFFVIFMNGIIIRAIALFSFRQGDGRYYSTGEGYVRLSIRAISVADIEIKFPLYCRARETDFYGTGRCDAKCRKMGYTTITREHPDYLKLRVLMTVFGGYFGSRLMSNIREEKGYTYGISAGIMFYPDSGLLIVSTETDNEYVEPLIQEVYHEIDRLHQEVVPVEELSMVRNYMLGEMCRSYESAFHCRMHGFL